MERGIRNILAGLAVCAAVIACVSITFFLPLYTGEDFFAIAEGWRAAQAEDAMPEEQFSPEDAVYADEEGLQFKSYTTYHYDARGNCVKEIYYQSDGTLNRIISKKYDARGNLTFSRREYPLWGWEATEVSYKYDEENRMIYRETLQDEAVHSWQEYEYRAENGLTHQVIQDFSAQGEAAGRTEYIKNANGDPLESWYYDKEGELNRRYYYEYDQQGRQIYYYIQKGGAKKPMREIYTQYEGQDSIWVTYEPLGHFNALEYIRHDQAGNKLSSVYYLSGYQGHKESQWNTSLKFWEGYWADYQNGLLTEELGYDQDLKYYRYYVYEGEQKTLKLEYEMNGGTASRSLKHYLYDAQGRLAAVYEYRISGEAYEQKLNDGSTLILGFYQKNGYLKKVEHCAAKEITDAFSFDENGRPADLNNSRFGELPQWGDSCPWQDAHFPWQEPEQKETPEYYVVKEGDCLWKIAMEIYGNAYQYREIYECNRSLIGADENLILPGMELVLP